MKKTTWLSILGGAAIAVTSLFVGTKGQTTPVINPATYSFDAPANYDDTFADGSRKVVSLRADVFAGAALVLPVNLGHPAKDAANKITVGITRGSMAFDVPHTIVVTAVNAFESTPSDPSDAFVWSDTKPGKPGKPTPKR